MSQNAEKQVNSYLETQLQLQALQTRELLKLGNRHGLLTGTYLRFKEGFFGQRKEVKHEFIRNEFRGLERSFRNGIKSTARSLRAAKRIDWPDDRPLRVAVTIAGGIGDVLQRAPFLARFFEMFSPEAMHLYVHRSKFGDPVKLMQSALPFVGEVRDLKKLPAEFDAKQYDLHIEIVNILKYRVLNQNILKIEALAKTIERAGQRFEPFSQVFELCPRLDGFFGKTMGSHGLNVLEACGYFGGIDVARTAFQPLQIPEETRQNAQRFGLTGKTYITLHDGFDTMTKLKYGVDTATRCWPSHHWDELVRLLKAARPDIEIVQLGSRKAAKPMAGVDHMLLDTASFLEACAILAGSALHIDSESGMVSVAWSLQRPTISIQGPTASDYYQIGNTLALRSEKCGGCWWIKPDWMSACVRGLDHAECMVSIEPVRVAENAVRLLIQNNETAGASE